MFNEKAGITLIILVITVVIALILVTVTINMAVRGAGVINSNKTNNRGSKRE